ncbi:phage portal family protein [Rufibacter latericius]|uniref:Phage portal protein n=1 Tax=Rufibacter latericius TaxID=2487040 RepID=A0A3M9MM81_9BACT|nr:hypothetical protein [Rufibacter latericius]RNI26636.1 hypothetical protein EFB08_11500 [Rufibacter latericius]
MPAPINQRMKKATKAQNLKSSGPSAQNTPAQKVGEAKVIKFGGNDKLPHEIIDALRASGTAKRCWKKLDSFLQADGFSDTKEAEREVNLNGETADTLLDRISSDYSALDGFALRVKYNLAGNIGEIYHVPFQTVRKMDDGTFLVNPTYGTKQYKKDQDEIVPAFDPEKYTEVLALAVPEVEGSQKGQILYIYRPTTDAPVYPVPDFWTEAGRLDIESDAQISKSDHKTLRNNLRPAAIVFIPGLNATAKDEDGKTEFDYATDQVAELVDPENEGEPIVLTGDTKEAAAQILPFDNSKNLLSMDGKRDTIGRAVCRHFGMPPALVGFSTAGQLGNNQEMLNSINLVQDEINRKQRVVQRVFKKLFPDGEWTISTLSPLKVIPAEIWATMTDDEKRNFAGLQSVESTRSKEADKTLQALNTLPSDVRSKVMDAMSDAQILALAGLLPENTQNNADNQG